MKALKTFVFMSVLALGLLSCSSTRVTTDYDKTVDFDKYETFAFFKPGIDEAKISDLDKRRILRAIDAVLSERGMQKTKEASLLIGINTDEATQIDVYENYYGWYDPWYDPYFYGPWYGYPHRNSVQRSTQGALYINLIDAEQRALIWQGRWEGTIKPNGTVDEKTELINKIVREILDRYPPGREVEKKKK